MNLWPFKRRKWSVVQSKSATKTEFEWDNGEKRITRKVDGLIQIESDGTRERAVFIEAHRRHPIEVEWAKAKLAEIGNQKEGEPR